tara:strand:+ start:6739 stop:7797 length:1059 start_codon:yes stop_codon:yes gene_type:complete
MTKLKCKEFIIRSKLLIWYKKNKRRLPWRKLLKNKLPNPYYIMVSEFMLQQTTVGTVKTRFVEFISKWPNIDSLSKISQNKILNFWSGLGYYSRAINLLKTAKIINKKFDGKIPNLYNSLITLPGVGDYTAKAILGIAYNKPIMPIDVNIERIIARLYGYKSPLKKIKAKLEKKSTLFISKKFSTDLIQAFMDYGSIVCKPKDPDCENCIIKTYCVSYKKNYQNEIPFKIKKQTKKRKKYSRAYVFCNENNEILVRKRPSNGMLPSMLEVPNDIWVMNKKNLVYDKIALKLKNKLESKALVEYSFSHFKLETEVFFMKVKKKIFPDNQWIKKNNIKKSGLPTVMKKIVQAVL